ncbi:proto-oncogene tyrosine-protein kinase receptor Ret-like isoform X2 [Sitophilus oryzae]|uniref:Proto-oncogene tyrosine-protein kinase receptor Ret-like isoform X2 n=1 Tax=Sitophilus oryzae TaxID=7048 RepID=A0A6J2Y6Z8_SITOR|nr:proto-oncogene tyrosine-protein kinase receptor Ret-like isoform X2 [Sitophilus oryzae]
MMLMLYFVVLGLNVVNAVYFTMTNMEGVIPVVEDKLHHLALSRIQAGEGSANMTYSIQNFQKIYNDVVSIDHNTGDIYISSPGPFNTSLKVGVKDMNNSSSTTYLKISLQNRSTCDDTLFNSICFWSKITYQVKENSPGLALGSLAPVYDFRECNVTDIFYTLQSESEIFKLRRPTAKIKYWTVATGLILNRTLHGKELTFNVTCSVSTTKIFEYTKSLKLKIVDLNDNLPVPEMLDVFVRFHGTKIKKGETVVQDLVFLDEDDHDVNIYRFFIPNKTISEYFEPDCMVDHRKRTKIICLIKSKKSKIFKKGERINFLLGLQDTNLELKTENNTVAAPFARVTQPEETIKSIKHYHIKILNAKKNPFKITKEGIVYVSDTEALRESPEFLRMNISWLKVNTTNSEEVVVRIVEEPTKTCENVTDWTFCSHFPNQKECTSRDSCALGTGGATNVENRAGPQRCLWRGDKSPDNHESHIYSTCSADTKYCPDGICDSLEELDVKRICPQDCSKDSVFPATVNEVTKKGIDKCNGILICEQSCLCKINFKKMLLASGVSKEKPKPLENKFVEETKCGADCIVGTAGGLLLLVCVIAGFVIMWKRRHGKKIAEKYINSGQEAETPFSDYIDRNTEPMVLNFNISSPLGPGNGNFVKTKIEIDTKWEFPRDQIVIDQILGEGEFGKVLKAKAFNIAGRPGYSLVAVKTLKDDARKQDYNDLYSEYQLLKEVSHPHVIGLLGICSTSDGPLFVIIEYAEFGSLRNYLRRSRHLLTNAEVAAIEDSTDNKVAARDILSFARQIASGMSYLSDIKLVHRDLAARNILLAKNKVCKISDFGLTRDIYEDNAYFKRSKGRVPVKWMAPESLADHIYTTKSDVWSFGILIWELVTLGASPYPGLPVHNLYNLLKQGYRMERPPNCSIVLYSLMNRCWNIDPEKRPSFLDLYHCFENLLTDNVNYLDLSDNAIINKCYFSTLTHSDKSSSSDKEDVNLLQNYLEKEKNSQIAEKCKLTEYPEEVNMCIGYETPVKVIRVVTPTNLSPEGYTDMTVKE